jgi:hypothetical protein
MGDPASNYATSVITLWIVWPHKPHHYVRVEIPSVWTPILACIFINKFINCICIYTYIFSLGLFLTVDVFLNHSGFLDHIQLTHAVGLLWTSDQPVAEASTYTGQHNIETQETNMHALSGIRARDPSNQAAADLRLWPRGYRGRLIICLLVCNRLF